MGGVNKKIGVWFPTVRTNTGTDVFTERLVEGLKKEGIRAEITWLPLRAEYCPWSVPIPKAPSAPQPAEAIQAFKQKHQLEDKKILLSVGRLTTRKGLKEFVENTLPNIVKKVPNTLLLVVGEAPKNSLGAGIQTQEEILKAAQGKNIENHIKFIGVITDKTELACAYESADIHVFPVRHIPDDPEGFGMVAIEAAAHGLPTVAFATGGIVDAVKEGASGYLVEKNNYEQLSEKTVGLLKASLNKESIKTFSRNFEWSRFGNRILSGLGWL